jgi:protein O-mannosyl-transferase
LAPALIAKHWRGPAAVAACAVIVYLGALWNRFAMDDIYIIVLNPLVRAADGDGLWRAFAAPYWPAELGGKLYRPLVVASYVLDRLVDGPAWFHAVNVFWHAAASVAVALLGRRLAGDREAAGLVAGLLFAVHPVHVEAVANVVGRAELMAGAFAVLAVYAAVARGSWAWSAAALALGLLCKENAAVVPGLILLGWLTRAAGPPPTRRVGVAFVASWIAVGAAYLALRWAVLHPFARLHDLAPVFVGAGPIPVRLTAVAAFADYARLLVFPLTLRADYSPNERTLVTGVLDGRFLLGVLALAAWGTLLILAWRRGRRTEAMGLAWIGVALLPVANLLFPVGILVADRTLYLPSVGLAVAAGAWLCPLERRRLAVVTAAIVVAGGLRTALRVPVWRDDAAVTTSILDDAPGSYRGPARTAGLLQSSGAPRRALDAYQTAVRIYDRDPTLFIGAADAAFTVGRPALADSLLQRAERLCFRCVGYYRFQAAAARARGDSATADSLLARVP